MAGAEPFSARGGPLGVLVLHGFTGNPSSMRALAEAPGRRRVLGRAAPAAGPRHGGRGPGRDPLVGLVGGGRGGLRRAGRPLPAGGRGRPVDGRHAHLLAGRAPPRDRRGWCSSTRSSTPDQALRRRASASMLEAGTTSVPGIGSDIAKPGVAESAYPEVTPLAAVLSLFEAAEVVAGALGRISSPVLLLSSREDHVVPPSTGTSWPSGWPARSSGSGWSAASTWPPSTTTRRRVVERTVDFVRRVTSEAAA